MKMRRRSPTEIQYIYLANKSEINSPIFPPEEFDNYVIRFIKHCPKDILHLADGVNYYELSYRFNLKNLIDFKIVYDYNLQKALTSIVVLKQIRLFFLDAKSKHLSENSKFLLKNHKPTHFYHVVNEGSSKLSFPNKITSPFDFIRNVILNQIEILSYLGYEEFSIFPSINIAYSNLIKHEYFGAAKNNYLSINSLIGNFGGGDLELSDEESEKEKLKEISIQALQNPNTFQRQDLLIEQIKKLDFFLIEGLNQAILSPGTGIEAPLAPLIIIAPFNNPDIDKFYFIPKDKVSDFIEVISSEQSANYISSGKEGKTSPNHLQLQFAIKLTRYLDDVSYLHSTSSFSPILRLPIKGKSIYRELSFFRTSAFAHLNKDKNRKNLRKTILNFSKAYKKYALSPAIEKQIQNRDSQIILISDLPLEWLSINDVPLVFTHDVCRLPATGLSGIMGIYALNSEFQFLISKNIIKKTLVIFGSSESHFRVLQEICTLSSQEKGFQVARCECINDVEIAILKHKPDLLIFDCHGSYNDDIKSTVLWIGNDQLTPGIIVDKKLVAPLIFLSACGTAPTYGVINTIANAFFEIGSFAVTTTYLPVEVNKSSILYLRLLNNLSTAAEKGLHKNWLEFLGHLIRSSELSDKFSLAKQKSVVPKNNEKMFEKHTSMLLDLLLFRKRRDAFLNMDEEISKLSEVAKKNFTSSIPEYLFYSNLGRADLIEFETWQEKFSQKNKSAFDANLFKVDESKFERNSQSKI